MEIAKKVINFVMDILETIVFVGSLFIVIYLFVMQPNQVKGASMDQTFNNGDYILTSKIAYKFGSPQRGDVVVFASLRNKDIDYIKRIIGIPGDRVMVKEKKVFVNGVLLNEPYLTVDTNVFEGGFMQEGVEIMVPDGQVVVFGDNRPRSSDSREFGPIPYENIIGKVIYRYFPPTKMGWVKNPFQSLINTNYHYSERYNLLMLART